MPNTPCGNLSIDLTRTLNYRSAELKYIDEYKEMPPDKIYTDKDGKKHARPLIVCNLCKAAFHENLKCTFLIVLLAVSIL